MRKLLCLLVIFCLLLPLMGAAERENALPELLQMNQAFERRRHTNDRVTVITLPHTACAAVDAEMEALLTAMADRAEEHLPPKAADANEGCILDVGASVYRTGDRWMSFLSVATIRDGREQIYADLDARAYDMSTGRRLTLADVVAEEGLQALSAAAAEQLAAYFPQEAADAETLAALTGVEALADVPFTLNTAYVQLHYRADALYPGKNTLMHVRVSYGDLRPYLTEQALIQTDNSARKLIALTYDDGPVRSRTLRLVRNLRAGGANATFFIVGDRIRVTHDELCLEHDAGFAIASHNYEHIYGAANKGKVIEYRDKLNGLLGAVTGSQVHIMRAPGGQEKIFIDEDVHLPLIHWSVISRSKNGVVANPEAEAKQLAAVAKDGDIILLHDMYSGTDRMAETLPQLLAKKGFLCVTVEELFAARGVTLEPNQVYWDLRQE